MALSHENVLVFVLRRSGCIGRLATGRIERAESGGLNVYNTHGILNEYVSGHNLRSWCVVGPGGRQVDGWAEISPEDRPKILAS